MINRIGSAKKNKKNKKLYKLTEFLGKEHDLQMFCSYLSTHYPEISQFSKSLFSLKINKLRKKALRLYPKIVY